MSSASLIATLQLPRLIGLLQARSCLARTRRLAKLGMDNWLQWGIPAACALVSIVFEAEVSLLFVASGAIGVLYYRTLIRGHRPLTATLPAGAPVAVVLTAPIGIAALAILVRWKVSNPLHFVGAACFALLALPAASARLSDD